LTPFCRHEALLCLSKICGEVCCFLYEKIHAQQKVTLSWRKVHPFFKKRRLRNLATFWFFELEDARNTWT
jgi:hypothetical protein